MGEANESQYILMFTMASVLPEDHWVFDGGYWNPYPCCSSILGIQI